MAPGEPGPVLVADPRPCGGFAPIATDMQYLKSVWLAALEWASQSCTGDDFATKRRYRYRWKIWSRRAHAGERSHRK